MILILYFAIIIVSVAADLYTKYLVQTSEVLVSGGTIDIIPGVLRFRLTYNTGAAMGMLSDNRWIFMIASTVAIIALVAGLAIYAKKISKLKGISFSLFIGGGIGNMVERIFNGDTLGEGAVTDFIDFCAFPEIWPWIFNVADMCVCIGAGVFILAMILEMIDDYKKEKAGKAAAELSDSACADDGCGDYCTAEEGSDEDCVTDTAEDEESENHEAE